MTPGGATTATAGPTTATMRRLAALYVAHGGGPMPLLGVETETRKHLQALPKEVAHAPRAVLVVSAHWEAAPAVRVLAHPRPAMLFDYYGFPPETYEYRYPAPGDPALARRVKTLLGGADVACDLDDERGFDHGVFVPLMLAYPDASVPVVALSLHASLDPSLHLRIGEALRPLRDEGVLLVASGMSFHNMAQFQFPGRSASSSPRAAGAAFDDALTAAVLEPNRDARNDKLRDWTALPGARDAHPREEHLAPLFVAAGSAYDDDKSARFFHDTLLGARVSAFRFG